MAISANVSATFQATDARTVGLASSASIKISPQPVTTFTDGTGAGAANQLYQATRSLTAGADSVDLTGSLTDGFGTSVTFARIKALFIRNNSTSNTMSFGAGSNPFINMLNSTGTLTLRPGGWFSISAPDATGYAVTAGTGDLINVTGTGTDSYDIAILGATS